MGPLTPTTQSPTAWQRVKLAVANGANLVGFNIANTYAAGTIGKYLKDLVSGSIDVLTWTRAATAAVSTTIKRKLDWQEVNLFEFLTVGQIAAFMVNDTTSHITDEAQAWMDAVEASNLIGVIPPGNGRVTTAVMVAVDGVRVRGHGIQSKLTGDGCDVFEVYGNFFDCRDAGLFAEGDTRTHTAINFMGSAETPLNYPRVKDIYFQGWANAIRMAHTYYAVLDGIDTINTDMSVRMFGQCVSNSIVNSNLICNEGIASIGAYVDGIYGGEGLVVTNCVLASGNNAFASNGFVDVAFHGCTCDALQAEAFVLVNVRGFTFDGPWIYSTDACIHAYNTGADQNTDAFINCTQMITIGTGPAIIIEANCGGFNINGHIMIWNNASTAYHVTCAGPRCIIGNARFDTTNGASGTENVYANSADLTINSGAQLPKGVYWNVSPIRVVASAATLPLPIPTSRPIEFFTVTGIAAVTGIANSTSWTGKSIVLYFEGIVTMTDGGNMRLAGNFVTGSNSTMMLVSDGTVWYEVSRSAN